MPPIGLPRRMFAAARMRFAAPLLLGAAGELRSTIADVRHRAGKSGDLVFVDVDRLLLQEGRERVVERQTIVYRGASETIAPIEPLDQPACDGEAQWSPGTVDLFRFSAVTFNPHRIHYDWPYATGEEGYPNLVVHGPFAATRLCDFAARSHPGARVSGFSFRAVAPLFAGQTIRLRGRGKALEAVRCDGVIAMSAEAEFMEVS